MERGLQTQDARRKARAKAAREKQEAKLAEEARLAARASMDDIDDYLEKLYDEAMDDKLQGAKMILALCADVANLEVIIQNGAVRCGAVRCGAVRCGAVRLGVRDPVEPCCAHRMAVCMQSPSWVRSPEQPRTTTRSPWT